jgi:hypothetical protein
MAAHAVTLPDIYSDSLLRVAVIGDDVFLTIGEEVDNDDSIAFVPTAVVAVSSLDLANAVIAGTGRGEVR